MALTKTDLQQIRKVMDESISESIAIHPRFDQMETKIIDELTDQMSELMTDSLELTDQRFNVIESRLSNLRIVSR
jgi:hypothetical protein